MSYIKNTPALLQQGDVAAKEHILELLDRLWDRMDSYKIIKEMMFVDGDILHIGECTWDLSAKRNIYMFGAGKACNAMAMAVDEILGDRLKKGVISVKIAEDTDAYSEKT